MKIVEPQNTGQYPRLNKDELVDLVTRIMDCQGTEEEIENWLQMFEANVSHPKGSDLIFYPKNEDSTPDEIVEIALSYKTIQL